MKRSRILVVDDDADITLTLRVGLEENGFAVDFFNDPKNALANYKPHVYDFMLIDVKMPRMNGFELYREIQKIDKNVKVGFITGFSVYYESLKEVFPIDEDISFFIKKPIEIGTLVKRIQAEMLK
jgi:DNA-binding response OmpR family regulator